MHIAQNLNFWISRQFLTPKISDFQILSYRKVMYLKRKLRTCRIQIQEEKVGFFWKNWISFYFCEFRVKILGDQVSSRLNFQKFEKQIWKMALLGPVDCWKEQSQEKSAHLTHCPKSHGQKTAGFKTKTEIFFERSTLTAGIFKSSGSSETYCISF